MSISNLLSDIEEVDSEVSSHDLEVNSGGSYISEGGIYPTTIDKAFMSPTKKGGVQLNIMFGGANKIDCVLYIVSMKNGKKITTCQMQGKTVSLPDFKMFKQIMFLATGKARDLSEVKTKTETIKYKAYGKDIEVEAETVVDLIGKDIQIGVRLEEQYNYEDGETDKTQLKTNQNGDVVYKKSLESVFNVDGFSTEELLKEAEEPKAIKSKEAFLTGAKGIKRVTLEFPEDEVVEDEDDLDSIPF